MVGVRDADISVWATLTSCVRRLRPSSSATPAVGGRGCPAEGFARAGLKWIEWRTNS
jgi:hypothetical protein